MDTFAYCAASFERSVRRAAGTQPLTCPPASMETFDAGELAGRDFIYFKLHGLPGEPYWYGDDWQTALCREQLQVADLSGAVVFVANCNLPQSPMLTALLDAGPVAVIGGPGQNYARSRRVDGADLLGLYVRRVLSFGFGARDALAVAMLRLKLKRRDKATRDTLAFRIYGGGTHGIQSTRT